MTFAGQPGCMNYGLTQAYSVFSKVIWPVYIPVGVWLVETVLWRKKLIAAMALADAAVSLYLLFYLAHTSVVSKVQGYTLLMCFPIFMNFLQPVSICWEPA